MPGGGTALRRLACEAVDRRLRLSDYADNCRVSTGHNRLPLMKHALHNPLDQLPSAEALLADGVERLFRRWQASSEAIGKLCEGGAQRWQAAIRQIQAPVNLAQILRERASLASLGGP